MTYVIDTAIPAKPHAIDTVLLAAATVKLAEEAGPQASYDVTPDSGLQEIMKQLSPYAGRSLGLLPPESAEPMYGADVESVPDGSSPAEWRANNTSRGQGRGFTPHQATNNAMFGQPDSPGFAKGHAKPDIGRSSGGDASHAAWDTYLGDDPGAKLQSLMQPEPPVKDWEGIRALEHVLESEPQQLDSAYRAAPSAANALANTGVALTEGTPGSPGTKDYTKHWFGSNPPDSGVMPDPGMQKQNILREARRFSR